MDQQEKKKLDLKDLDLATGVDKIPEWWNRHGNKVLIVITVAALGYALFTFRKNAADSSRINAETNLTTARELLSSLRSTFLAGLPPEQYSEVRRDILREGTTRMGEVLAQNTDPKLLTQALLLQGDIYYSVAMLPEMDEATTRPTLKLEQTSDQLFESARTSYQAVIDQFADRKEAVAAARLGLAAVAENKSQFDEATKLYKSVADDESVNPSYRAVARGRLNLLPTLSTPMRIFASTRPSRMDIPVLPPSTQPPPTPIPTPATAPAAP